ncbi:ketose-bisphosphate aldolase [Gammaproteobacteria bacterium]|nr:ketose-bisphosphate aldolase [Gammaproteobacteria bacterium]
MVNLRTILDHANKHQYAVPAFNINFQAQINAVLAAALETNSPAILQLSSGGVKALDPWMISGLMTHIRSLPIPICIHRDHTYDLASFKSALDTNWFTSLMMDGSICPKGVPRTFEENIAITQQAIKLLQSSSVSIEAELGCLGALDSGLSGEEDGHKAIQPLSKKQLLTCPDQAAQFIAHCPVDALAIAIGTSHGAYKFSSPPNEDTLSISRVKELHKALPEQHFVLHGSSSVARHHLQTINNFGGQISQTYGVPVAAICETIPFGVRKVNIDTDLRLGFMASTRRFLQQSPAQIDPRALIEVAKEEMQTICQQRFNAFGTSQKAPLIMKEYYEATTT